MDIQTYRLNKKKQKKKELEHVVSLRPFCYHCFRPQNICYCSSITALDTQIRFVLLMHPKEAYKQKTGTGRMTHISLTNSEIIIGADFTNHARVTSLINNPNHKPVILYPGPNAIDVERDGYGALHHDFLATNTKEQTSSLDNTTIARPSLIDKKNKQLVVFVIDATWSLAKKIFFRNECLQNLTQISIQSKQPSQFKIKRQPNPQCLSTIESVFYLLDQWEKQGLEDFKGRHHELPAFFQKMVDYQIQSRGHSGTTRYRNRKAATISKQS